MITFPAGNPWIASPVPGEGVQVTPEKGAPTFCGSLDAGQLLSPPKLQLCERI